MPFFASVSENPRVVRAIGATSASMSMPRHSELVVGIKSHHDLVQLGALYEAY